MRLPRIRLVAGKSELRHNEESFRMQIVSVINYKGGVGKTTLTANLAAELAWRGYDVLMIDLDAQASLTFSFIAPDDWQNNYADNRTIKELVRFV